MVNLEFSGVLNSINKMFCWEFEHSLVSFISNFSSERNVREITKVSIDFIFVSVENNTRVNRVVSEFNIFIRNFNSSFLFNGNGGLIFSTASVGPKFLFLEVPFSFKGNS